MFKRIRYQSIKPKSTVVGLKGKVSNRLPLVRIAVLICQRDLIWCVVCAEEDDQRELETSANENLMVSTSLSSINLKEALPTTEILVDWKKRIALVDSGCSQSLVTRSVYSPRSRQELNIMTENSEIIYGHGVGNIILAVNNLNHIRADVLTIRLWYVPWDGYHQNTRWSQH